MLSPNTLRNWILPKLIKHHRLAPNRKSSGRLLGVKKTQEAKYNFRLPADPQVLVIVIFYIVCLL